MPHRSNTQPAAPATEHTLLHRSRLRRRTRTPQTAKSHSAGSGGLYAAHQKVYPRGVDGHFSRLRTLAAWILLGMFYGGPWLQWNHRQAVLFDLPARKFYVWGLVMWPQDFIFLTGLLIIAALSLFFFTALAGRLWCGYACPQTVWTEAFLWMERKVEGERAERMRLDAAAMSARKFRIKTAKFALWIAFSLWTGFTFVGYFTSIRSLGTELVTQTLGPWETFWILFYSLATFGNAGFLREQVCKYMCPYARFQSAMFDRNTLIISYDAKRGEQRGARGRGVAAREAGLGDCTDCTWCVQVCPTGIDIRDGLQEECIACAACIDACDSIMDKMGYARGLIRYSTENEDHQRPKRVLRPRVFIYAGLLTAIIAVFATGLVLRNPVGVDVIRDRNALYRVLDDGRVENVYDVKILNKTEQDHSFRVTVAGDNGVQIDPDPAVVSVKGGEVAPAAIRVRRAAFTGTGSQDVRFVTVALDAPQLHTTTRARFIAPAQ
jgi:cytochrome c oxidase accessory protein FixG